MCASEIGCISVIPLRFVHVTSRAGSAFCLITACRSAVWTDRCLTAHPLRDVWVVFSFRLLRMKLPCTSLYKFLCENRFNLSGINKCPITCNCWVTWRICLEREGLAGRVPGRRPRLRHPVPPRARRPLLLMFSSCGCCWSGNSLPKPESQSSLL